MTNFNNPAAIALNETRQLFHDAEPGVFLSLGTGLEGSKSNNSAWKNCFPFRIARAFFKLGDSDDSWNRLINSQQKDRKKCFFRFNPIYNDGLPPLDDVDSIDKITRVTHENAISYADMDLLADTLRAGLFTFELDLQEPPRFQAGTFRCKGIIRCLLGAKTLELSIFLEQLKQQLSSFWFDENICHTFSQKDINEEFTLEVHFQVSDRYQNFAIQLKENERVHISGSPFTLHGLMKQQHADACFGTELHQTRNYVRRSAE